MILFLFRFIVLCIVLIAAGFMRITRRKPVEIITFSWPEIISRTEVGANSTTSPKLEIADKKPQSQPAERNRATRRPQLLIQRTRFFG